MRVHLIKQLTIIEFTEKHSTSKIPFMEWLSVVKRTSWDKPSDIKKSFSSADLLGKGSNRVIFDIGGNNYRMICEYYFGEKEVHLFICWIGTHKKYDELLKSGEQYTIEEY